MKWNHLPLAGGLYDQHPKIIEQFRFIFQVRAAHEAEEAKKRERNGKKGGSGGGRSVAGRRR